MSHYIPAGNRRVLIIDDTPSMHEDYRKILSPEATQGLSSMESLLFGIAEPRPSTRYELDHAYQGRDGHALAEQALAEYRPYAMAFVDMRMPPGWNGLETIERLWRLDPDLQIALCTAFSDLAWDELSERLNLNDRLLVLKKPFDAIEIRQIANTLTAKWQAMQENKIRVKALEITIEHRASELLKLAHHLQYDALTGLPNLNLLRDRLVRCIRTSPTSGFSLLYIGLDRLKHINNAWGYPFGDAVLQASGTAIQRALKDEDVLYRPGSDQFVVVGDFADRGGDTVFSAQLLAAIATPRLIAGEVLAVTASIGVSRYPEHGDDPRMLIKRAETAMHEAKGQGRNTARLYDPMLKQRARDQQSLEGAIRRALENDEFVLHYQPKIDLRSGRVIGCEALIRWFQPNGEAIPPTRFIPVAEESGLIVPLSRWVLKEACRQTHLWHLHGLGPLCTAINLSPVDFRQGDFLPALKRVLESSGVDPGCIELEITERLLVQDHEGSALVLQGAKSLGVRLAIDDFGTGYSNLGYLKLFPVDTLKIDQSFVRDIGVHEKDAALVAAIIAMSDSLGLTVTAEGVETAEQLEFLTSRHCDEAQGYHFSRALPAAEFAEFARRRNGHAGAER
ncbi:MULTISPECIES: putative bifunctional diguanylate cyclase/phosphodiesterase [unclassified Pseudomonas]|uniref:putative bifunctional diguanylate cyclase/phosphodiesterase n=1 Tax=unclassified Pseudomonas TaxID=196821 RepID=UPI000DA89477|nr:MULTISPECIES: EAL domain-containing protein [unclassified Pseudomonas]MDW3711444.1 EAL domain-containing protein [Pseudomonas sp. 2023EL-01195]PZE10054.1 GGDEF domain-containing response regulator [Pseudomonas sp. 57B-090624]